MITGEIMIPYAIEKIFNNAFLKKCIFQPRDTVHNTAFQAADLPAFLLNLDCVLFCKYIHSN